jgi:protein-L-isoaspartate O-methyltransferase
MAHTDQPLKEGNVHISAPHIYGTVLEALELSADSSMSFLNAGSGTCYLSCLCAAIMGKRSSVICKIQNIVVQNPNPHSTPISPWHSEPSGVEIHDDVIEHSKKSVAIWKEQLPIGSGPYNIDIVKGNALHIIIDEGECARSLFDRIYVGASIEKSDLPRFRQLLKPGGILVGPGECSYIAFGRR